MHNYLFDAELVRLAIVLGVVVGLWAYQQYGVTTGGTVVPGYLALFILRPTQIVTTLVIAGTTYLIVQKQLRPRWMLWGRKLFESEIIVALILQMLWTGVVMLYAQETPQVTLLYSIGFLLPGIIAHDMGRQGVSQTVVTTLGAALAVFSMVVVIGGVRDALGLNSVLVAGGLGAIDYTTQQIMIAVCVSVFAGIFLYHNPFVGPIRSGGFITAAYLALLAHRPLDLLIIALCALATYLIVTKFLMKQAIIFGRSKIGTMILVGMIVTWGVELGLGWGLGYTPWAGFNAIVPMMIALLANDSERQGISKTALGAMLSTLVVMLAYMFA